MLRAFLGTVALCGAWLPSTKASATDNDWNGRIAVYGFMPHIDGEQSFAAAEDIHIKFSDLLDRTQFAFMGVGEVRRQRVGAFADLIYLNLADEKTDTDRLGAGTGIETPLPPGVTADLKMDMKATIVTVAPYYRVHGNERSSLDLFAGARMNRNKARLDYAFSAPFGPFAGPLQQGSVGKTIVIWDAVVGAKGRVNFGPKRDWFALGYADAGAGESKSTWQVFVGGGHRIGPVDALIGWRKLHYSPGSSSRLDRLSYSGPMVGASLSF